MKAAVITSAVLGMLGQFCHSSMGLEEFSGGPYAFIKGVSMPCAGCGETVTSGQLLSGVGFTCERCAIKSYMLGLVEIAVAQWNQDQLGDEPVEAEAEIVTQDPVIPTDPEEIRRNEASHTYTEESLPDCAQCGGYGPEDGILPCPNPKVAAAEPESTPESEPAAEEEKVDYSKLEPGTSVYYVQGADGKMKATLTRPESQRRTSSRVDQWRTSDPDLMRRSDDPFVAPAIVKKASQHVHSLPEADLSSLPEDQQSIFEGYRAQTIVLRTATDMRNYEATYGDPEVMAILDEETRQWAHEQGFDDEEGSHGTGVRTREYNSTWNPTKE